RHVSVWSRVTLAEISHSVGRFVDDPPDCQQTDDYENTKKIPHDRWLRGSCPPNAGAYLLPEAGLGRDKARYLSVRFLIPPVEHRACGFHRPRRNTFSPSPWPKATKRSCACPQHTRSMHRAQLPRALRTFVPV